MARIAACPKCRNQFTLPVITGPTTIACPFCNAHITIKPKQSVTAGARPVQAPRPVQMTRPVQVQATKPIGRAMPVEDDETEDVQAPRGNKKKGKKKKAVVTEGKGEVGMKIAIVGGIVLLFICALVFAFWWFITKDSGKPNIIAPTSTTPITGFNGEPKPGIV